MDRRQFLKLVGAFAGATALPVSLAVTVVLEPMIDEALLEQAMSVGKITKNGITMNMDLDKMWQAVYLVDQWGHEWRTEDRGQTWSWNGHSFNVEGDISWA